MANAATDEKKPQDEIPVHSVSTPSRVPHTHTESTLAPTSEFVRYLLLALPARYLFRSVIEGTFAKEVGAKFAGFRDRVVDTFIKPKPNETTAQKGSRREYMSGLAYDYALGASSLFLTFSYSSTVYRDIKNMFCEAVGLELGKPADQVSFGDISRSENKIVRKTVENFKWKCVERFGADLLFFVRPLIRKFTPLKELPVGDMMIGVKAAQALGDTWKRKTTMFEDLVTFVNNKINPRNGLGQTIGVGEVFDLYQHYADGFMPDKMFRNVLERGTGEGMVWAKSQPVFQRIADLMNDTYTYKHHTVIDPETGHSKHLADFTLPTFIHLLGNDLIDPYAPERTLAYIELANAKGIDAVKQAQASFASGMQPADVLAQHGITAAPSQQAKLEAGPNGVIPKGSTAQLSTERAEPISKIDTASIAHAGVTGEQAARAV